MLRRRLLNVVKLLFGVAVLGYLAHDLHAPGLVALARRGDPLQLCAGVACLLVGLMYFQWQRLHVLIKGFTDGVRTSLEIFYVGAFFNQLLPSNIGGDAIRLVYLKKLRTGNWGTPFMLLLLHRVSGFVVLLLAGLVYAGIEHARLGALLRAQHPSIDPSETAWLWAGVAVLALLALGGLLARRLPSHVGQRVLAFVRDCRVALRAVSGRDLAWLMVNTFGFHLSRMLGFYCLVRYLGQQVSLWDLVFVISATAIAAVLPITVAGLGVVEGSISSLLGVYGVVHSSAVVIALVHRMVLLLMAAIGGVVYAATRQPRTQPAAALEPSA